MSADTKFAAANRFRGNVRRGEHHNAGRRRYLRFTDLFDQLKTVCARHLRIYEKHRVARIFDGGCTKRFDGFAGGGDQVRLHIPRIQNPTQNVEAFGIVVHG